MSAAGWSAFASWVAIAVTLGIAIVGWSHSIRAARRADDRAAHAETRADEALRLAQSAEDRADRLERIQVERRHVVWEREDTGNHAGALAFTNVGTDPAYNVVLTVTPDGGRRRDPERLDVVEPGERIQIVMTDLAAKAAQDHAQLPDYAIVTPGFEVRASLTWSSASGVEDHLDFPDEWVDLG